MPEPLPEHVIDRMAKEVADYLAPLYPNRDREWLEQAAQEQLAGPVVSTPWPNPTPHLPGRVYLTITVGWYDRILQRAHIGDDDGPTWWTEERPTRSEREDAYWEGRVVL
jgi:hypothetical protein